MILWSFILMLVPWQNQTEQSSGTWTQIETLPPLHSWPSAVHLWLSVLVDSTLSVSSIILNLQLGEKHITNVSTSNRQTNLCKSFSCSWESGAVGVWKKKKFWVVECSRNLSFVDLPARLDFCDIANSRKRFFFVLFGSSEGAARMPSAWENMALVRLQKLLISRSLGTEMRKICRNIWVLRLSQHQPPPCQPNRCFSSWCLYVCVRGSGCYGYAFLWISLQADK